MDGVAAVANRNSGPAPSTAAAARRRQAAARPPLRAAAAGPPFGLAPTVPRRDTSGAAAPPSAAAAASPAGCRHRRAPGGHPPVTRGGRARAPPDRGRWAHPGQRAPVPRRLWGAAPRGRHAARSYLVGCGTPPGGGPAHPMPERGGVRPQPCWSTRPAGAVRRPRPPPQTGGSVDDGRPAGQRRHVQGTPDSRVGVNPCAATSHPRPP